MDSVVESIKAALDKICQSQRLFLWDIAKKEGLSPIQIQFIEFIQAMPMRFATVSNLAKEFELTKATVSDSVRVLVKKGLLVKVADEQDKRKFFLKPTAELDRKMGIIEKRSEILTTIINTMPGAEQQVISRFLMNLIKQLYDSGYIQSARMCLTCGNFVYNNAPGQEKRHLCKFAGIDISDGQLTFNCPTYLEQLGKV